MNRLKNKIAIITGGSRGIGYTTADAFLREGAIVIITASTYENAQKAKNSLKEKTKILSAKFRKRRYLLKSTKKNFAIRF